MHRTVDAHRIFARDSLGNELALGCSDDPQWVSFLIAFAEEDVANVWQRVASSLPTMFAGDDLDASALSTLVSPSADAIPWARLGDI